MTAKSKPSSDLSSLPSVDELLRTEAGREFILSNGSAGASAAARRIVETMRREVRGGGAANEESLLERASQMFVRDARVERRSGVLRVINATGVVIHTNLGRAPLATEARNALLEAAGYCTLEYDLEMGKRGRRGKRAERLAAELAGAEDAVIVNNGAAAAFLVLTALAAGGEVVVSRGELVEIGGDFRVPDVLAASGATLREVGTTNRTKLADYSRAIGENTRMLLRVHPSNYRIVGFTATPSRTELAGLAHERNVLFYEDLGSGALIDVVDEPVVSRAIKDGVDLISFSGDKLLGGPQAGIIAGKAELVETLRKHPLYRVLRADKLAYAAIEATLLLYSRGDVERIPVIRQLRCTADEIAQRAESLAASIGKTRHLDVELVDGVSAVGGGAAPTANLPTKLVALTHKARSAEQLERRLRMNDVPVIARIESDQVLIDLRTVAEEDEAALVEAVRVLDGAEPFR